MTHQPEKLNLWDRFMNRYRKEVHSRGSDAWSNVKTFNGYPIESTRHHYQRDWVEYKTVDRLTGSETIEREYLT